MKIEIPVKVFKVAGKYYVATYDKGRGYSILDMNGSPFSSEAQAKKKILDIIDDMFLDLGRPKLLPEFKRKKRPSGLDLKK